MSNIFGWRGNRSPGRPANRLANEPGTGHRIAVPLRRKPAALGIYLLRPPEHPTVLLANAQYDWLFKSGKEQGWTQVPDGHRAQHLANEGYLVVAVYKESDPKHHGHIAIVRPSTKSDELIDAEGPQITQAGAHNTAAQA